jgi:pantothenate kinase
VLSVPEELLQRAEGLARHERALLGLTGPPGAGKSTLGAALVSALGAGFAVLVPMDGFHLADAELARLGRADRKGAPDTFDVDGYVHLLTRLVQQKDDVVYAPVFRRELELAEAGALAVPKEIPLVITEGNYLLSLDATGSLLDVRDLLTECWYLDLDPVVRRDRLIERHVAHGRTREAAEAWVDRTDERNARLVERTRDDADLVVPMS